MSLDLKTIVETAAKCMRVISKLGHSRIAEGVRARARQLFEALVYQGLPYVLAYAGAKAGESALRDLYGAICRDESDDVIVRSVQDITSKLSPEDASYGLYGASLICVVSRALGGERISKVLGKELSNARLEDLIYRLGFDDVVQRVSQEAARWLKFFAEAKLTGE